MARTKSAAQIAVPQDRDEAVQTLDLIGSLERQISALETDQTERINKIKEETELKASPLQARLKALKAGLQTFCDANRKTLTNGGKVKFHNFGTGQVSWRNRVAKVSIKNVEAVLGRLMKNPFQRELFVRTKHEINRDALRAKPEMANSIEGISVGAEGEDFVIEANFEEAGG